MLDILPSRPEWTQPWPHRSAVAGDANEDTASLLKRWASHAPLRGNHREACPRLREGTQGWGPGLSGVCSCSPPKLRCHRSTRLAPARVRPPGQALRRSGPPAPQPGLDPGADRPTGHREEWLQDTEGVAMGLSPAPSPPAACAHAQHCKTATRHKPPTTPSTHRRHEVYTPARTARSAHKACRQEQYRKRANTRSPPSTHNRS